MSLTNVSSAHPLVVAPLAASATPVAQSPASEIAAPSQPDATTYTPMSTSPDYTYALPGAQGAQATASAPIWKYGNSDAVSQQMNTDLSAQTIGGRFAGLGAALLGQFANSPNGYAQSALIPPPAGQLSGQSHPELAGKVTLDIATADGDKVQLDIKSASDGSLFVQSSSSGTLTQADQSALSNLATAFQTAIDGFTGEAAGNTTIDVSGLMQYDPKVLSSVELNVQLNMESASPTTLDFQADAVHRSINANLPTGAVNVNVGLNNMTMVGTKAQQNAALQNYVQQFRQEEARDAKGADPTLMQAFADSLTQLNSNYPPSMISAMPTTLAMKTDQDQAMLTGLADFQASVSQTPLSPNPYKLDETDQFTYQTSQQTLISGTNYKNRAITQTQSSNLTARYHVWLSPPATAMKTTKERQKENYYYEQINDSASATTDIGYQNGGLARASISKNASQSRHETKFVNGNLAEDATISAANAESYDLIPLLKPLQQDDPKDATRRAQVLLAINSQIYLESDPTRLSFGDALDKLANASASDVASNVASESTGKSTSSS